MVRINGEQVAAAGKTIAAYLEEAGYDRHRVAVELNRNILPRAAFAETRIKDGDVIEIVGFVGGG
ncbi:MAG: sulfur carrier protein ThiS [Anaerovoracaceae bacterium]|jgi:sulfur carrier protein